MYQNAYYQRSTQTVHIWDDADGHIRIPYKPYAYRRISTGTYQTLDGHLAEKVTSWDQSDLDRKLIYESDIKPVVRTLIDKYYESDEPSKNHRILFFDIETGVTGGYAKPEDPWQPITAIAMVCPQTNLREVIILDKEGVLSNHSSDKYNLVAVKTESELLVRFLETYYDLNATILTGWNIDYFDIPYLYNRIKKVLGEGEAHSLSPISEVEKSKSKYGEKYSFAGVSILDYMGLYKLLNASEEPSYSLEAISTKELGRGKIKYEGTLDDLFRNDPEKYIEYNFNDVDLIVDMEQKLQYMAVVQSICHKGHVCYEDVYQTTRYLDGACITYLKRLGIVVPNKPVKDHSDDDSDGEDDGFDGAYVKIPTPGLYEWVFDVDMSALYPSVIRTLNISPETKIGIVTNWLKVQQPFYQNSDTDQVVEIEGKRSADSKRVPLSEFRGYLRSNSYTISSTGVIYDNKTIGLVPSILVAWMAERDELRALSKKYSKAGDTANAEFFNARQAGVKRINNSLYGVMGSPGFRFYDLHNAEATTQTGVAVITNAMAKGNEWFANKLGTNDDHIIYVDTDSTFFSAMPIIRNMEAKLGRELTYQERSNATFKTAEAVENYINADWPAFCSNRLCSDNSVLTIKQEYVAETAFWVAKKRYAQKIVSEKGVSISDITSGKEDWKLDVKGLDVVRSDFPKAFREFFKQILINILDKVPKKIIDDKIVALRDTIHTHPILDIMFPTGVKNVDSYIVKTVKNSVFPNLAKGVPIHVRSAINYNSLLEHYKLKEHVPIRSGDKIRWAYLKQNQFGLKTIALKGNDDPEEIVKFVSDHIDPIHIYDSALEKKMLAFYEAMNWGSVPKNNHIDEFFSF